MNMHINVTCLVNYKIIVSFLNITCIQDNKILIQKKVRTSGTPVLGRPRGSIAAFLNPNHSATRFLPQSSIFGLRKKSNPVW